MVEPNRGEGNLLEEVPRLVDDIYNGGIRDRVYVTPKGSGFFANRPYVVRDYGFHITSKGASVVLEAKFVDGGRPELHAFDLCERAGDSRATQKQLVEFGLVSD